MSFDESYFPSLSSTTSSPLSTSLSFDPLSHIPLIVSNSNHHLSPPSSFSPSTFGNPSVSQTMSQPPFHNTLPMLTHSKHGIFKPKTLLTMSISSTSLSEPCSTSEALSVLEWHAAMEQEFQAFYSNHTWSLVPPPLNHQVMGCKRVFKVKTNFDGSVNKYKARLVVKGFYQVLHFDFHDTYSPVIKPTTIRAVLALAISNNWTIKQLDFNNTFLNGILKENVYMSQPPGFVDTTHPH